MEQLHKRLQSTQVLDLSGRGETPKRPHPGSVMISTACVAEGLVCCGGFNGELVVANLGQPGHVARWSPTAEGWEVEGVLLTGATLKTVTVTEPAIRLLRNRLFKSAKPMMWRCLLKVNSSLYNLCEFTQSSNLLCW